MQLASILFIYYFNILCNSKPVSWVLCKYNDQTGLRVFLLFYLEAKNLNDTQSERLKAVREIRFGSCSRVDSSFSIASRPRRSGTRSRAGKGWEKKKRDQVSLRNIVVINYRSGNRGIHRSREASRQWRKIRRISLSARWTWGAVCPG